MRVMAVGDPYTKHGGPLYVAMQHTFQSTEASKVEQIQKLRSEKAWILQEAKESQVMKGGPSPFKGSMLDLRG